MALYYSIPDLRQSRSSRFWSRLWTSKIPDDKSQIYCCSGVVSIISVSDPGSSAFLTPASGKNPDPGSEIWDKLSDHISESFEQIFWVQNT
jgi:hypothetical protein